MVLLVIDAQKGITNPKLYCYEQFVKNVQKLIGAARENGIEVIYVCHDDGLGEKLTKGNDEFEIDEAFAPRSGERIFDKKVNSPFQDGVLLKYLKRKKVKRLIVTGLQTDYCIDATVKCGFEHHFEVLVPQYANSTFDNPYLPAKELYEYYNHFMWDKRYARSVTVEEMLELMQNPQTAFAAPDIDVPETETSDEPDIGVHIADLCKPNNGWTKELRYRSFGNREPVYDIRTWYRGHSKSGNGVTITQTEMTRLKDVLNEMDRI